MQSRAIEVFYLLFQGVLVFQVLTFCGLYFVTGRKDLMFYSLFLFFAASYFFINAPYTFFGVQEDVVWNSHWYAYINDLLIVIQNLFYLLFLKSFFSNLAPDNKVRRVFNLSLLFIPLLLVLFLLLSISKFQDEVIYYLVQLIPVIPSIIVADSITRNKFPFAAPVAAGLVCNIMGTCLTVFMNFLRNRGIHHLFTEGYPLFFVRVGILGDMIFFLAAILKKWHFQEKQLAIEKLKAQLADEQLRTKVSAELHDDLGSTLSGISMYSHLASSLLESGDHEKARKSLEIIEKSAHDLTTNLSDLVWALKPKEKSFEKLLERIEQYGMELSAARNISFAVLRDGSVVIKELSIDLCHQVYLFAKEAINNAVKYSNASLIELLVKEEGEMLGLSIRDNGRGFDTTKVNNGNGIGTMSKRAADLGGRFFLDSKINQGTLVSIQCKIT